MVPHTSHKPRTLRGGGGRWEVAPVYGDVQCDTPCPLEVIHLRQNVQTEREIRRQDQPCSSLVAQDKQYTSQLESKGKNIRSEKQTTRRAEDVMVMH
jgi:hypothetical protein